MNIKVRPPGDCPLSGSNYNEVGGMGLTKTKDIWRRRGEYGPGVQRV